MRTGIKTSFDASRLLRPGEVEGVAHEELAVRCDGWCRYEKDDASSSMTRRVEDWRRAEEGP
jgi:hypothetical protein